MTNYIQGECGICPRVDEIDDDLGYCVYCLSAYQEGVKAAQETVNSQSFFKGKVREREDIIRQILQIRDEWQKTPTLNFQNELSALVDKIDAYPVNYIGERK